MLQPPGPLIVGISITKIAILSAFSLIASVVVLLALAEVAFSAIYGAPRAIKLWSAGMLFISVVPARGLSRCLEAVF